MDVNADEPPITGSATVLVVEDDASLRLLCRLNLELERYRVFEAGTIDAAVARARKLGLTRVELTVRKDNRRAIALYRKVGFVSEGIKRAAFRVDGRYYDLLSMAVLFKRSHA